MHRILVGLLAVLAWSGAPHGQAPAASGITVFEGELLIADDGRAPIENATLVVNGARIAQVGRAGAVGVPAGAFRLSLAGKTVMPAIVDTHTHLSQTRDALAEEFLVVKGTFFATGCRRHASRATHSCHRAPAR